MRLLILNWRDLEHPRAGGSEVFAQSILAEWARAGHELELFCAAVPGRPERETHDGYEIVRAGSRLTVYREAARRYRQDTRFDAILDVVNTRPFMTPRWVRGTPVVALIYQLADDVWRYEVPLPAALLGRHVLEPRWLREYRDVPVLTISESSRASLAGRGLRDVSVIPVGVDPPLDRPVPERETVPTWLFVGRLSANKRPDHALAAHRLLRERLPDAQLWVVGDGPMREQLQRGAPDGVRFFGRVDAGERQDLMSRAHAVIGTAVREGWGMTITEAARLGTRSLAYDVPGLRDSVPGAGGVLTAPDPASLAEAAARRLPEWVAEGRAKLGDAGVCGWSEVADDVLGRIEAAAGARGSAAAATGTAGVRR